MNVVHNQELGAINWDKKKHTNLFVTLFFPFDNSTFTPTADLCWHLLALGVRNKVVSTPLLDVSCRAEALANSPEEGLTCTDMRVVSLRGTKSDQLPTCKFPGRRGPCCSLFHRT